MAGRRQAVAAGLGAAEEPRTTTTRVRAGLGQVMRQRLQVRDGVQAKGLGLVAALAEPMGGAS